MKRRKEEGFIEARLYGVFASLFFSIPTAVIAWLWINIELTHFGGFLGSTYLVYSIVTFAVIALVFPRIFPAILGYVWRAMMSISRFWY